MNEHFPDPVEQRILATKDFVEIAEALVSRNEVFPFRGIDPVAYATLKADELEYPGYGTPIDEIVARFKSEGFKVVFTDIKTSGNVMLLPANSQNIDDNLLARQLLITDDMDETLKKLILNSKEASKK